MALSVSETFELSERELFRAIQETDFQLRYVREPTQWVMMQWDMIMQHWAKPKQLRSSFSLNIYHSLHHRVLNAARESLIQGKP